MKSLKLGFVALCIVGISACAPILTEDQLEEALPKCDNNGGLEKVLVDSISESITVYYCKDGARFYD